MAKPKLDKINFVGVDPDYAKKFSILRDKLSKPINDAIEDYEQEVIEIKDPKNKRSKEDIDFVKSICIDHIVMAVLAQK